MTVGRYIIYFENLESIKSWHTAKHKKDRERGKFPDNTSDNNNVTIRVQRDFSSPSVIMTAQSYQETKGCTGSSPTNIIQQGVINKVIYPILSRFMTPSTTWKLHHKHG